MNDINNLPGFGKQYPEIGSVEIRRQIGKEIKSAREFHQLNLEDIRALTKIHIKYLKQIEEGSWSFLPPTYVKAFIRSFSEAVNISPDKIVTQLDNLFRDAFSMHENTLHQQSGDDKAPSGKVNELMLWAERNRSMLFYGTITVVAIILIVIFLLPEGNNEDLYTAPTWTTSDDTRQAIIAPETLSTSSEPEVELEANKTAPSDQKWSLKIYAVDTCYVKLESADTTFYEKTLWPRNYLRRELTDQISASFGNIHGVKIIINGDTLAEFQGRRRVRRIELDRNGLVQ